MDEAREPTRTAEEDELEESQRDFPLRPPFPFCGHLPPLSSTVRERTADQEEDMISFDDDEARANARAGGVSTAAAAATTPPVATVTGDEDEELEEESQRDFPLRPPFPFRGHLPPLSSTIRERLSDQQERREDDLISFDDDDAGASGGV